jgi:hypothetical protein
MRTFRFRPLDRLEERATPATMTDLQWAYATTQANAATIRALSADPEWMANPVFFPHVVQFTQMVVRQSTAASLLVADTNGSPALAGVLGPMLAQTAGLADANAGFAQAVANLLNFSATPPVPPNDAGMVNTMPDVNAPQWVTQANGLKTWDVVVGNGPPVAAGDNIRIFYTGWLAANGTQFDSRRSPNTPITFDLDNLIPGWKQGIPGMEPGGIRRLYIPSALGYGAAGSPPNIPGNADLVFEIKMISHS